jgi:hypothetical protein
LSEPQQSAFPNTFPDTSPPPALVPRSSVDRIVDYDPHGLSSLLGSVVDVIGYVERYIPPSECSKALPGAWMMKDLSVAHASGINHMHVPGSALNKDWQTGQRWHFRSKLTTYVDATGVEKFGITSPVQIVRRES